MDAKEYFERIRDEVASIEHAKEMLARLKAREGAKAQSYSAGGGGGGSDPMDAINGRIDFEGRLERRIADSQAEVDEACVLLYGADNRGGLAKLKGNRYADALCMACTLHCCCGKMRKSRSSYAAALRGLLRRWCDVLSC